MWGPLEHPTLRAPEAGFLRVERQERETAFIAEIENCRALPTLPHPSSCHAAYYAQILHVSKNFGPENKLLLYLSTAI
jgi:hypothetical protein